LEVERTEEYGDDKGNEDYDIDDLLHELKVEKTNERNLEGVSKIETEGKKKEGAKEEEMFNFF
jgi:hypothetical protein